LPSWFLTISPSDIDSPLVMKLSCPENDDIEVILANSERRAQIAAMNPIAGAKYFRRLIDKIFTHLFETTVNGETNIRKTTPYKSKKMGILGKLICHFVVFEVQGRGALHLHSLIWSSLSPALLQKVAHVPELVKEVQTVIDSIVRADITVEGYIKASERKMEKHVYRGQLEICPRYLDQVDFKNRLEAVITTVNIHKHRETCHHGKAGKIGCRFRYPQPIVEKGPRPIQLYLDENQKLRWTENIEPPTISNIEDDYYPIDEKDDRTIMWELARKTLQVNKLLDDINQFEINSTENENVVPFNDIISASIGCNTCLEPLGSREQAKAAVFYQLKYITKQLTEITNTLSVLYQSKKLVNKYPSKADDSGTPERNAAYLLNKVINTLSTQTEVSAMMAAASLMGMPSHMCSHTFWFCFIWPAIRFLKNSLTHESNTLEDHSNNEDLGLENFDNEDIFDLNVMSLSKGEGSCQLFKIDDKFIAIHQHIHYMYRGEAFANYNFLEYCAIVKIKSKEIKSSSKRKCFHDEEYDNNQAEADRQEKSNHRHIGRTTNASFDFQEGHPLVKTHTQCINSKIHVPILAGYPPPTLPAKEHKHNHNWNVRANKFAEYYIALMVPWCIHTHVPLIPYNYQGLCNWMRTNDREEGSLIDKCRNLSINEKATCLRLDSSKKLMMNLRRGESATTWGEESNKSTTDGIDDENKDTTTYDRISQTDIDTIVALMRDVSNSDEQAIEFHEGERYIANQMKCLESLFPITEPNNSSNTIQNYNQLHIHPIILFQKTQTIKQMCKELSKDFIYDNVDNVTSDPSSPEKSSFFQEDWIGSTLDTSSDPNLNNGQNYCLQLILEHLTAKENHKISPMRYNNPPPFKLIIHGGPGTGKTRLAESIVSRIRQHGGQVACAAPTGVAASLLYNGRTLHNLFDLPTKRKQGISSNSKLQSLRADQLTKARYRFDNACLLIIDEMSMIDTTMLDHISTRLQQITECNDDFGGIPIILMGDMFQLPPAAGESMYKTIFKKFTVESVLKPSQNGCLLFTSFTYYELTMQMRSKDLNHSQLIYNMRNIPDFKQVAQALLQHLQIMSRQDIINDHTWLDAPIIVTSNYERHVINMHQARAFALSRGLPVLIWKKPLVGNLPTMLTNEALDILYDKRVELIGIFVQPAPCNLREENINPTRGLANGTAAYLHSICFDEKNELNDYYTDIISKAKPGELINIPVPYSVNVEIKYNEFEQAQRIKSWPEHLTLQPGKDTECKAVVIPVLLKTDLKGIKLKNTTLDYKDHFVDLSFAMTFHKIQGKTVSKIILDINHRPGSRERMNYLDFFALYVGISRIQDSNNMRILPPHDANGFSHFLQLKCDPRLRRWIKGYNHNKEHWEMVEDN
jgi:hypothetical protein